jgi:cytochrome c oxidase assembly protein subunit 15
MSATAIPMQTHRLPSPALQRFAWGVLVYFIAVILWGGLVRATGSGAGCVTAPSCSTRRAPTP